jgi:RNA polymerase sigma factor (sigma-70 family)
MDSIRNQSAESRIAERRKQGEQLQQTEAELNRLRASGDKEAFFAQILPLLTPLKSYIKRQLRIAYLTMQIRTPVFTSRDFVDEVVLRAYENYDHKPRNVTLEQWLYQIANELLGNYIRTASRRDARRRSLEDLTRKELKELEEPITADSEGEVMLVEDLDDSELPQDEFVPPAYQKDPNEEIQKEELVGQILQALSHIPPRERSVFELSVIEGFSNDDVARIAHVAPDEVPEIVHRVLDQVRQELAAIQKPTDDASQNAADQQQSGQKKAA